MIQKSLGSCFAISSQGVANLFAVVVLMIGGCGTESTRRGTSESESPAQTAAVTIEIPRQDSSEHETSICFDEVALASGVTFQWSGGPTARCLMPEQNGGGVAILDFDRDGLRDLAVTDCGPFTSREASEVQAVHLFQGTGDFEFQPISDTARLGAKASATGIAAGDFDSDGFSDLFIAAFGQNRLLHNYGDGTFEDATERAGVSGKSWSTSVAFADLNADGHLDIYVVNYVDWTPTAPICRNPGYPDLIQICSPMLFNPQPDQLLISNGDGTYRDAGKESDLLLADAGNGLAVEITDLTADGIPDVFVANDVGMNNLFRNLGSAQFVDVGLSTGIAVSSDGAVGASMGTACADYNRDGELDLFVTNFRGQVNDLYSGIGAGGFIHTNGTTGLDILSRHRLAFGAVMQDFDLDGWPDLFVANGHIWDLSNVDPDLEYQMSCDILRNVAGKVFRDVSKTAGQWFSQKFLARAVAAGDLNNDGRVDLVVQNVGAPLALLKNCSRQGGPSRTIQLIGTCSSRDPLGNRVEVRFEDESLWATHVPSGGSFQSSHDPRLIVPLGNTEIDRVSVTWSNGNVEAFDVSFPSGEIVLIEGGGTLVNTQTHTQ